MPTALTSSRGTNGRRDFFFGIQKNGKKFREKITYSILKNSAIYLFEVYLPISISLSYDYHNTCKLKNLCEKDSGFNKLERSTFCEHLLNGKYWWSRNVCETPRTATRRTEHSFESEGSLVCIASQRLMFNLLRFNFWFGRRC